MRIQKFWFKVAVFRTVFYDLNKSYSINIIARLKNYTSKILLAGWWILSSDKWSWQTLRFCTLHSSPWYRNVKLIFAESCLRVKTSDYIKIPVHHFLYILRVPRTHESHNNFQPVTQTWPGWSHFPDSCWSIPHHSQLDNPPRRSWNFIFHHTTPPHTPHGTMFLAVDSHLKPILHFS